MENNIKVFRVHRALSWLYGFILCLLLIGFVYVLKEGESVGPILMAFIFFGFFFSVHHFISKGAKNKRGWARGGSAVIAVLMLFGFPLGTAIGIYLLINNSGWGAESA